MPRTFTNDASVNTHVTISPVVGFTGFTYGTAAAVLYHTGSSLDGHTWFLSGTPAQDFAEVYRGGSAVGVGLYNGAVSADSNIGEETDQWMLVAITKATGSVTPRGHSLRWTSQTWEHTNSATSAANASGAASEFGIGGFNASFGANSWHGHLAAVGVWHQYVMTDSEIERLARGRWSEYGPNGPDLLVEFPSGRDEPSAVLIDNGRNRMRQSSRGSQVSRTNIAGPPGFRYSALNRRR